MSSGMVEKVMRGDFHPNDHYVAVMGVTGAGKSTFIAKATGKAVKTNDGYTSCTKDIDGFEMTYRGERVWLLDTPGFNDSNRTDTEVFTYLTSWLMRAHEKGVQLSGLIYLHNLTANRMYGSSKTYLETFRGLCGDENLKSTSLVTTMWSEVPQLEGEKREKELLETPEFWGDMIANEAQPTRHEDNHNSAVNIIGSVLNRKLKVTLAVQVQMAQGLRLRETTAGKIMFREIEELRADYDRKLKRAEEDTQIALDRQKVEAANTFLAAQKEHKQQLDIAEASKKSLDVSMKNLLEIQERDFQSQLQIILAAKTSQAELMKTEMQNLVQTAQLAQEAKQQQEGYAQSDAASISTARPSNMQFDFSEAQGAGIHYSGSSGNSAVVMASAGIATALALSYGCVLM